MLLLKRNNFSAFINGLIVDHPTPANISYLWNGGSLAALALIIQVVSGLFLAMHYVPNIDFAFVSVEHIMRDVGSGWFMRYVHSNGASFFFICVYLHIFRGLYYGSYLGANRETWLIGVTMFLLMMGTAFLGYVLPWGQMSLWGATVITNFLSVIPFVGDDAIIWLWGGFSVNNATLNRFYSLHFFLPFCLLALLLLHLIALHSADHTNPLGISSSNSSIFSKLQSDSITELTFYPYFIIKDIIGVTIFILLLAAIVFFVPNILSHPDNYTLANPLLTPQHIVPEWYFLPFYAILRSIPSKTLGILTMFMSILILYFLPFYSNSRISSAMFRNGYKLAFWAFVASCLILGWIGGNPVEEPFYSIGKNFTIAYFTILLFVMPAINFFSSAISALLLFLQKR